MRRTGLLLLFCLTLPGLYLLAWPVPVDPVAWQAPEDQGLTGDFAGERVVSCRAFCIA